MPANYDAPFEIVHLAVNEGLSPIFISQVLNRAASAACKSRQIVVVITPIGHFLRRNCRKARTEVSQLARSKGVHVSWIPSLPSRFESFAFNVLAFRMWLTWRYWGEKSVVLHCRNATATNVALLASKSLVRKRIVFDCRGAECPEFLGERGRSEKHIRDWPKSLRREYETLIERESKALRESDYVLFVSHQMRDYFCGKYGVEFSGRSDVIPCCVDTQHYREAQMHRETKRDELGISDRLVIAYCGSLAFYQLPDQSIRVFMCIAKITPTAHFLAITTDPGKMQRELEAARVPSDRFTVVSVKQDEVASYLATADVGLLLRERSDVNRVSSPVKFGEYMAAGLPVVLTEEIGDYSQAVLTHALGCVIDLELSDAELQQKLCEFVKRLRRERFSERCDAYTEDYLRWELYTPLLLKSWQAVGR